MKSTYQFDSAQEISPEIIEAIKTAFSNNPIRITIESTGNNVQTTDNVQTEILPKKSKQFNTDIAESLIDMLFDTITKKSSKKK